MRFLCSLWWEGYNVLDLCQNWAELDIVEARQSLKFFLNLIFFSNLIFLLNLIQKSSHDHGEKYHMSVVKNRTINNRGIQNQFCPTRLRSAEPLFVTLMNFPRLWQPLLFWRGWVLPQRRNGKKSAFMFLFCLARHRTHCQGVDKIWWIISLVKSKAIYLPTKIWSKWEEQEMVVYHKKVSWLKY